MSVSMEEVYYPLHMLFSFWFGVRFKQYNKLESLLLSAQVIHQLSI